MQVAKNTLIWLAISCVALTSAVAQIAPQTPSPTAPTNLTAEERAFALQQFQTTHDNFVKSIAGLSRNNGRSNRRRSLVGCRSSRAHRSLGVDDLRLVQKTMQSPATPENASR